MAEPGVIADYAQRLARMLSFDPSLSRSVQSEVEDHLWESVRADPADDAAEAQRRAVERFGEPRAIAVQFATVSLANQARRHGTGTLLIIATVFVVMRARLTWYAAMKWPASQMGPLGDTVMSIDRYAFWLSVFVGISAWVCIGRRGIPAAFTAAYRSQLRRFFVLGLAAAGALMASVVGDGVLTAVRLVGTRWSPRVIIPLVSIVIEVAGVGGLVLSLLAVRRRATSTHRVQAESPSAGL